MDFISQSGDLRKELGGRHDIDTDQFPFAGAWTLAEFFIRVQACEIGKRIAGSGEPSSPIAKAPEQAGRQPESTVGAHRIDDLQGRQYIGSALAVFVPAQDLPGWSS
jgi:hypothetical protein